MQENFTWITEEFCYSVYNQCEPFICLYLMVKNRDVLLRGILSGGPVLN
jgi:hypothetical protein